MRVHFTGRHVEVTSALQAFAQERLQRLQKHLSSILEAHVILSVEKYRHQAEVNVHLRRFVLSGAQETGDMYTSIAQVFDKLERQARKRKEKATSGNRRTSVRASSRRLGVLEQVMRSGDGSGAPRPARRLLRTETIDLKPMSVEDALLQVEDSADGFVVFRNARSQRVNVVYRRRDGHIGIIEP